MKSRYIGIILIFFGLIFNIYLLEYFFSVDHQIETKLFRFFIWLFDIFLVLLGSFLYRLNYSLNKKYLIFLCIVFFTFIIFLEILFRLGNSLLLSTTDRAIDQYYGWVCKSNYSSKMKYKGYGENQIIYSTKMYGFRSWQKIDPNKRRILIIGDSVTQGLKVNNGSTYDVVIAEELGNSFQVFAYGCGGYGTLQEYMILDNIIDIINPEIIIIQASKNDISDNYLELEKINLSDNNFMRRPYLIDGNIEYHYPYPGNKFLVSIQKYFKSVRFIIGRSRIFELIKNYSIDKSGDLYQKALQTTEEIFQLIKKRIGDRKLFVFSADNNKYIKSTCIKLDIVFIDTVPNDILIAQNKGLIINGLPYDSHWNDIGNRIAGQSIFKAISSYLTNK